jgi:hypothetical protein
MISDSGDMTYTATVGIGRNCQADPSMPANLVREKAVIWDLFTDRQPIGAEVQTGRRGRSRRWGSRTLRHSPCRWQRI